MKAELLVVLVVVGWAQGARILAMVPFPGKSHYLFISAILQALSRQGHHVVEYSPFPPAKPRPNHTHVEVHSAFEEFFKNWKYEDFIRIANEDQPVVGTGMNSVWEFVYPVCADTFNHDNVKKLLKSKEHFDLVITESHFGQESMVAFGHKFGAPVISLQGFYTWSAINWAAGNALSIATLPDFTCMVATDQMTFKERVMNLLSIVIKHAFYYFHYLPKHDKLIRESMDNDVPPLVDMISNISLHLVNAHPYIEYPQPYTPNIIPVGGLTISPERTTLPQDIKKFMDEAKEGVIYFSFGTVVPAHVMPKETLQKFVNAFKKLKQKILWKIELDTIADLPSNVMLAKWVPQPGVLGHPNCVLFLTHGGLFSQQEALHAGVPTVAVPFFGDQPYNVRFSEQRGVGIQLDFSTLSEQSILTALRTVLDNPKYKENAVRLSQIYRDRPVAARESVVFWVEYVLRHGGAPHLRPASVLLSWYQRYLLDVVALLLCLLLAVCWVVSRLIKALLCRRQTKMNSTKKDK